MGNELNREEESDTRRDVIFIILIFRQLKQKASKELFRAKKSAQ